jgi:hypothetical protein
MFGRWGRGRPNELVVVNAAEVKIPIPALYNSVLCVLFVSTCQTLFQVTEPCPFSRCVLAAVLLKVYLPTLTNVCRCTACGLAPRTLLALETSD